MVLIGDTHLLGTLSRKFEKNILKMTSTRKNGLFLEAQNFEKIRYFPKYVRKCQNIFPTKTYMSQGAPKKFWASYLDFWQNYRKFLEVVFFSSMYGINYFRFLPFLPFIISPFLPLILLFLRFYHDPFSPLLPFTIFIYLHIFTSSYTKNSKLNGPRRRSCPLTCAQLRN